MRARDRNTTARPGSGERSTSERYAHAVYQRVLSRWAMDALELRRLGYDRPCFRGVAPRTLTTPPGVPTRNAPLAA